MYGALVAARAQVASVAAKVNRVEESGVKAAPQLHELLHVALRRHLEYAYERALDGGGSETRGRLVERQTGDLVLVSLEHARTLGGALFG